MLYFWFRRDLRLNDNTGLLNALQSGLKVQPVFIFDAHILENLSRSDARVNFIYERLKSLHEELKEIGSSLRVECGNPIDVWGELCEEDDVQGLYFNHDYEPYAIKRDKTVSDLFSNKKLKVVSFKDHVFFEKKEILKDNQEPYTIFTPYKKKWLLKQEELVQITPPKWQSFRANFWSSSFRFPELHEIGFEKSQINIPDYDLKQIRDYGKYRDFPGLEHTTQIGHHLRFGTVSIRALVIYAKKQNEVFLSELIWRDFFTQILFHYPHVVTRSFRQKYDLIQWRNNEEEFEKWCKGETGYAIVDAGMRQLNQTGFMHNRVRMIVASFLVKDLLIDWRWGEAYFAEKLLDFDLSANNGNWQWAAGTGCDAAPYFRIFNPLAQQEKFDPELKYIKKWIPNYNPKNYRKFIVDHKVARERTLAAYKAALEER